VHALDRQIVTGIFFSNSETDHTAYLTSLPVVDVADAIKQQRRKTRVILRGGLFRENELQGKVESLELDNQALQEAVNKKIQELQDKVDKSQRDVDTLQSLIKFRTIESSAIAAAYKANWTGKNHGPKYTVHKKSETFNTVFGALQYLQLCKLLSPKQLSLVHWARKLRNDFCHPQPLIQLTAFPPRCRKSGKVVDCSDPQLCGCTPEPYLDVVSRLVTDFAKLPQ